MKSGENSPSATANDHELLIQLLEKTTEMEAKINNIATESNQSISNQTYILESLNRILTAITNSKNVVSIDFDSNEDFSEFENMKPINTGELLSDFEWKLQNADFREKCMRFLATKFASKGTVNGSLIFKQVIGLFTTSDLFLKYSWKGQCRGTVKNYSFEAEHAVFVKFLYDFIAKVDRTYDEQKVSKLFIDKLRSKNIEHELELKRLSKNAIKRPPCVRNRPRKILKSNEQEKENSNSNQT